MNKSDVYKLNCNDCDAVYIGQTGRSFKKRHKEHETINKKPTHKS